MTDPFLLWRFVQDRAQSQAAPASRHD